MFQNKSRPKNDSFEDIIKSRRSQVRESCSALKYPESQFPLRFDEFYYQPDFKLLWCPVYKASSSNWLTNYITLSPKPKAEKDLITRKLGGRVNEIGSTLYPPLKPDNLTALLAPNATAKSLLIVRHPFYRLVSAYRDKIERIKASTPDSDWYYKLYGKKIVAKYRPYALKQFGKDWFSAENNYGTPLPGGGVLNKGGAIHLKQGKRVKELPTFWEFAKFVLDAQPDNLDLHWIPTTIFCSPCSVNFDYVVKFENLSSEEPMVKSVLNLTQKLPAAQSLNKNRPETLSDENLTQLYFKQLSKKDVLDLFKIYENDFRLFGYTFEFQGMKLP